MKLSTTVRNSILDAIDDDMNAGTTPEARFFVTNGDTPTGEAAAILLNTTDVFNADNAWLLLLGIATSGTPDITMSNNTISNTDTVQLTSLTITCPTGTPDVT